MSNADVESHLTAVRGPRLRHHLADFANMLKAFFGSNYLTIAFAFRKSGIYLGLLGLLCIASLTAHCCHLIVKCKYHAICQILSKLQTQEDNQANHRNSSESLHSYSGSDNSTDDNEEEILSVRKMLLRNMMYGDLGQLCLGKIGLALVNGSVMITQFGFCVGYYIFLGNTILSMFPVYNCSVPCINSRVPVSPAMVHNCVVVEHLSTLNAVHIDMSRKAEVNLGMIHHRKITPLQDADRFARQLRNYSVIPSVEVEKIEAHHVNTANLTQTETAIPSVIMTTSSADIPVNATSRSILTATKTAVTTFPNSTSSWTNIWILTRENYVPDLKLLVLSPVVFFVATTLIRGLRQMGIISFIANASIFIGCLEMLAFLLSGFKMSSTFQWVNWTEMPIFFGMVTSAFEGIGTILPIEASMEGNRHNFVKFLYGAVALLATVLLLFGTLGYLRFGDLTDQMINANIPSSQWTGILVNVCLCIGVLLTFPLMMYPVVELAELYIFGNGHLCGPKHKDGEASDHQSLLPKKEVTIFLPVAEKISDSISTWKRNCLRIFIVLSAGGLAILLRNYFAYISAFVGALGSTMLAYILPCLFHLKLCWRELSAPTKIKDIVIIIIGICCGLAGIYAVISQIVNGSGSEYMGTVKIEQ